MTVYMPTTQQEERWRWIKPIITKELSYNAVLQICPHSRRTLEYWVSRYRKHGIEGLVPLSTKPHNSPNKTRKEVEKRVLALRKETGLCAQKLHWRLKKDGLIVPVRTIGAVLERAGVTRAYRKKRTKYRYVKPLLLPGEMVEIDVKYVPGKIENKEYFQYTAIDCRSRWRFLDIYDAQSSCYSVSFLKQFLSLFPCRIRSVKTDNHSTFTNYLYRHE